MTPQERAAKIAHLSDSIRKLQAELAAEKAELALLLQQSK